MIPFEEKQFDHMTLQPSKNNEKILDSSKSKSVSKSKNSSRKFESTFGIEEYKSQRNVIVNNV